MLKSTPFRLALAFAALYLICLLLGSAFYQNAIEARTLGAIDRSLTSKSIAAQNIYEEFGLDGLIAFGESGSGNTMRMGTGFQLQSIGGAKLSGNIPQVQIEPGWQTIDGAELGLTSDETFRFYTFGIDEYLVSLGRSMSEANDIRQGALRIFFITFLGATALALVGSILLAMRSHSRIHSIVASMDSVAAGNLDARLPVSRREDDIDSLSVNMNDALGLLQSQIRSLKNIGVNMGHDLKTPLNRLNICIEEAANSLEMGHPANESLEQASAEIAIVNSTFESLLSISQIEAGARKADFTEVDLLPIVQTAHEVYSAVVEEAGQSIELKLGGNIEEQSSLKVYGDKALLLEATTNLIENAINHCPAGAHIVVEAGLDDGHAWLGVSDNGPGIPESEHDRVFERLYRLEQSRTSKGAGLGLSLVRAIADLHGAFFQLTDNEPGLSIRLNFEPLSAAC